MLLFKNYIAPLLFLSFIVFTACSEDDAPMEETGEEIEPIELDLTIAFAKNIGGSDIDDGTALVVADDGGFVIVGSTKSTDGAITDKNSDDTDVWVLKTDTQGAILWSKTFGGTADDKGTGIAKTSDGGYVISAFTRSNDGDVNSGNAGFNDLWVFKISSTGVLQWEKTYGYAGNDLAYNVLQTSDGGFLLLGVLDVSASNGAGNVNRASGNHAGGDYWVLKLDSQGERTWSRYYGGSFTDTAYDAVETASGGYIIMGTSDSQDVDITGNKGEYDYWILNIDADGNIIWKKNFGGSEIDLVYAMTKTLDGNYLLVGDTRSNDLDVNNLIGNADVWAVKINESGSVLWSKTFGGTQFDSARGVAALTDGTFAIAASSRSDDVNLTNNYGVNDAWFLRIDADGNFMQQKNLGGSGLDFGEGIAQTADGKIIVTGSTESADGDFSSTQGSKDLLLIKIE